MSVRICSLIRSPREKFFARLKSTFHIPGARTMPNPELPGRIGAPDALETGIN